MKCVITWWKNLHDPLGREESFARWGELFERFEIREPFRGQDEHPGWSPAHFDPCQRGKDNVRTVFALCLDYDGGTPIEGAVELWKAFYGLIHTSRKHTAEAHRFRVVLPLKRPISPFEFDALWRRVNHFAGSKLDPAPKDPSRFWFTPGVGDHDGAEYRVEHLNGAALDPDEWLRKADPTERPVGTVTTPHARDDDSHARRYALAALESETKDVAGTSEGGRNARLNAAAFSLGQLIGTGVLSDSEVWAALRQAARVCGLRESETEATIASGIGAGKKEPRRIPEPRTHQRSYTPEPPPGYDLDDEPAREPGDDTEEVEAEKAAPQTDERPALERYGFLSMVDLMQAVVDELQKPSPRMGAKTGSEDLDAAIGGFRHGNVTVFGAKRGFGKTSYGNLVVNLALPALNVAMFAGEDAAAMYGKRFLAMRAGINAMLLRDYKCNREDWPKITAALVDAPRNPFFVRVDGRPVEWISECIRELAKEQRVDLVLVDYLQCLRTAKRLPDRRNEVTYVTKTLGDAVKSVGAAGVLFSQLKRTERNEPEVEDLKESGDIEDMADHILLGWKVDAPEPGGVARRYIKLGKNKDGTEASEIAPVLMRWCRRTASFEETLGEASPLDFGAADNPVDYDQRYR